MKEKYKLYYKSILLGTVLTSEADFPSVSGKIKFTSDNLEKELQDYIDFSIMSSEKVLGDSSTYELFIEREESKHLPIIDSLDWSLVSNDGTITKILVPFFFNDSEINFRFQ